MCPYCQAHERLTANLDGAFAEQTSQTTKLSTPIVADNKTCWPDSSQNHDVVALGAIEERHAMVLPDSSGARSYQLPEVVVTSTRVRQTSQYTPSFITVVDKKEIDALDGTSLAEVLSPISGFFIKDYGGISGLKTIAERGMGTEHTLILLNGVRVSSMQNGLVDLGSFPIGGIGSVEVVRGGQSASYGADAVAGLVNVITNPIDPHTSAEVSSSTGSFGYRRYLVSGNLSSGIDGIRLSYGQERSRGDFPFKYHNGPAVWSLSRRNADYLARYANGQGRLIMGDRTQLTVVASGYSSERGVPGQLVSPYATGQARQLDADHLVQASLSSDIGEDLALALSAQAHFSYERYEDPGLNIGGTTLDTYFRNDDIRIVPRLELNLSDIASMSTGVELANTTASGNSLEKDVARRQLGAFVAMELTLLKSVPVVRDLSVFPTLRLDAISGVAPVWSPQLGVLLRLHEFTVGPFRGITPAFRSTMSRNFRMPTFNELYFSGGGGFGDPTLRPERSTSVDIGGSLQFSFAGEQQIQATFYSNDMTDRIVWTESSGSSVVPKNLRRVRSTGAEWFYRWTIPENLVSLELSHATSRSRKISADVPGDPSFNKYLPYVPLSVTSLSMNSTLSLPEFVLKEIGMNVAYSYVSYRYITEDNTDFLPSYQVVSAGIRGKCLVKSFSIVASVVVDNLLNEDYQVMPGYPMPQRSYRATVAVEFD